MPVDLLHFLRSELAKGRIKQGQLTVTKDGRTMKISLRAPDESHPILGRNRDASGKVSVTREQILEVFKDNPDRVMKTHHVMNVLFDEWTTKESSRMAGRLANMAADWLDCPLERVNNFMDWGNFILKKPPVQGPPRMVPYKKGGKTRYTKVEDRVKRKEN